MQQNYTLEIISHHPQFKNKNLRKYYVDGIDTVGAWGDEPFEIRFRNNSWQKVQVKLSLDGTDILTGDKANTDITKDMWVVNGYGTLNLKAWPETNNGGAHFIFTSGDKSVAVHTHGDLSNRGIIAAAVYTEGHVEPIRIVPQPYYPPSYRRRDTYFYGQSFTSNNTLGNDSRSDGCTKGMDTFSVCDAAPAAGSASMDYMETDYSRNLESLVSVGAGQHVDQKITYVTGLIKPMLAETVRIRYLWWDDLVAKLKENNVPAPHASGFPGDKNQHIMSLGKTPRLGNFGNAFPREQVVQSYLRV